jgi:hypothetical protein
MDDTIDGFLVMSLLCCVNCTTIGNESLHEITNHNGVRAVNFATCKNLTVKSMMFPHCDIHKYTSLSPNGKIHNQFDHILVYRRRHSYVLDVQSFWTYNIKLGSTDRQRRNSLDLNSLMLILSNTSTLVLQCYLKLVIQSVCNTWSPRSKQGLVIIFIQVVWFTLVCEPEFLDIYFSGGLRIPHPASIGHICVPMVHWFPYCI